MFFMSIKYFVEDLPVYVSRGARILSVLSGDGSFDIIPGNPDVVLSPNDFAKGERYDPEIDFDINSYSRVDKFDGLEIGQKLIDDGIDSLSSSSATSSSGKSEEK